MTVVFVELFSAYDSVPCMRRATSLAYTDADEDAEKMISFADDGEPTDKEDEWVQTHSGRST